MSASAMQGSHNNPLQDNIYLTLQQ